MSRFGLKLDAPKYKAKSKWQYLGKAPSS